MRYVGTRSRFEKWVLDITDWDLEYEKDGVLTFLPLLDDGTPVIGLLYVGTDCPGEFVGVFSLEGQAHVDEFWATHQGLLDKLQGKK